MCTWCCVSSTITMSFREMGIVGTAPSIWIGNSYIIIFVISTQWLPPNKINPSPPSFNLLTSFTQETTYGGGVSSRNYPQQCFHHHKGSWVAVINLGKKDLSSIIVNLGMTHFNMTTAQPTRLRGRFDCTSNATSTKWRDRVVPWRTNEKRMGERNRLSWSILEQTHTRRENNK